MKNLPLLICVLLIYGCSNDNKPVAVTPKVLAERSFELPSNLKEQFASAKQEVLLDTLTTTDPASVFQVKTTRIISTTDTTFTFLTKVTVEVTSECKGCTSQASVIGLLIPLASAGGAKYYITGSVTTTKDGTFSTKSVSRSFDARSGGHIAKR